jgi:hypothetical protein
MEEVALSFMQQKRSVSFRDHLDVRVWAFSLSAVNPPQSALCLIQHRHPSTTLKEQVLPIAEIAVRTPEGIHLWNENLDMETALPQVAQKGLRPL